MAEEVRQIVERLNDLHKKASNWYNPEAEEDLETFEFIVFANWPAIAKALAEREGGG